MNQETKIKANIPNLHSFSFYNQSQNPSQTSQNNNNTSQPLIQLSINHLLPQISIQSPSNPNQSTLTMGSETTQIAVVIVPLPAQGHLNPLLHLSTQLAARRIPVHYISSATHNHQARQRFHTPNLPSSHLHFHDLPFPPNPNPNPNPNNPIKFPTHLQPSFDAASTHLIPHLTSLLLTLSPSHRRITLLIDSAMSFSIAAAAAIANAEIFTFHPSSAICSVFYINQPQFRSLFSQDFLRFLERRPEPLMEDRVAGRLLNTCRAIEGEYIDRLRGEPVFACQRVLAIGPVHGAVVVGEEKAECEIMRWLEEQPEKSVVYVSFGTTSALKGEQVREIAAGLEASRERFIWVCRESDRCDVFEEGGEQVVDWDLAEFQRRVEGKGKVVTGWAPQLEILAHPSTGGFVSHCGWNSCMEAMSNGVPILAWPMHSDQPANAFLLTEVLMNGIPVKMGTDELVTAETVRESVARLMASDDKGKELRRRAKEIEGKLRAAVMKGGSSRDDFDAFLGCVTRP